LSILVSLLQTVLIPLIQALRPKLVLFRDVEEAAKAVDEIIVTAAASNVNRKSYIMLKMIVNASLRLA
jgi:uncharacterized protein YqgC (DUF456 family)